jgi:hypothetical protein
MEHGVGTLLYAGDFWLNMVPYHPPHFIYVCYLSVAYMAFAWILEVSALAFLLAAVACPYDGLAAMANPLTGRHGASVARTVAGKACATS